MTRLRLFVLLLCTGLPALAAAGEVRSTLDDQTGVAVTIYNQNLALVKDRRQVSLERGEHQLAFRGVSAQMRPETALLRNVAAPDDLQVIEQNFDFDLLTPRKLLEKYTGRQVKVARTNPATGEETIEEAKVLSTNEGVVLRIGDRIETEVAGRFIFDDVPDNLRDEPTLSIQLASRAAAPQQFELSYLTGGLAWKADYVAELNADDSQLDLLGWVTLTNNSGASYNDATLQLVAGNVNRVHQRRAAAADYQRVEAVIAEAESMREESLFEYHLYTLGRPTTIADRQTKQVSLLSAASVPVEKRLVLHGRQHYYHGQAGTVGRKLKPAVFVRFHNDEDSGLGVPLPKGIVRVYKRDSGGNAQFIGEDAIAHTAKNEWLRLKLGEAFDVTADKTQTDYRIVERSDHRHVTDASYEIELRNAKPEPVEVFVREPIPGDWEMRKESEPHKKIAAGTAEWRITVPAEGTARLQYSVRVRL